jgi:dephospho-CoA kinase
MSVKKIGFAFSGPIASGKSYMAESVARILDCNVYSFATKLKQFASILENAYPELSSVGKNRKLLRTVGQGLKSVVGSDIWVNATMKDIYTTSHDESYVIIDDLRYQSEYDALINDKYCEWHFIYLSVPQLTRIERIKKIYPENWGEHFNYHDICEIPIYKNDCIAFSIDHVLKFVNSKI